MDEKRICTIIFSKDRALQLRAAVESFDSCCGDARFCDVYILFKAKNDLHKKQYRELAEQFDNIIFIPEQDFKKDFLAITAPYEFTLFLVDDNIFIRDFSLSGIIESLDNNPDAAGFSLRLGRNITYNYMQDKKHGLPYFTVIENGLLKYNWQTAGPSFDYPFEVSSSIYRNDDIFKSLFNADFSNPNTLETEFSKMKGNFSHKPLLICPETSYTFCAPLNKVQQVYSHNRASGKSEYNSDGLAKLFADGKRINIKKYRHFIPESTHQEVKLYFIEDIQDAFFTVVIPCYKQAKFLRETVESVLEQTFKRIKIIIVNDGSPDNTSVVAGEIIKDYPEREISLLEKENGGVSTARNFGIQQAITEWVMPLDADDKLRSDFFEKAYEAIKSNPELNLVTTNLQQFGKGDGEWIPGEYSPQNILYYNTFLSGSIFRKELWEKAGGYYSGIPWGAQDWNFWIDCSRVGITPYKIPEKLFLYRIHGGTSAYDRVKEHWPVVSSCIYTLHPDLYPRKVLDKAIEVISYMDSESVERLEKITKRHPDLAHPYFWLGLKKEKEGNYSNALELFQTALEKSDKDIFMLKEKIEELSRPDLSGRRAELSLGKRILLACDYFWPSIGGVELFIEDLGMKLSGRGFEVEIACRKLSGRNAANYKGMKIHEFDCTDLVTDDITQREMGRFVNLIKNSGYDAVIMLSAVDNWLGFSYNFIQKPVPKLIFLPSIRQDHIANWRTYNVTELMQKLLSVPDELVTVSESGYDRKFIKEAGLGYTFIPHAVEKEASDINFRDEFRIGSSPLFLCVGNFWPEKNQLSLIRIMKNTPGDWQLVLIGHKIKDKQNYFESCQREAEEDGRIRIIPGLPREKAAAAIRDADILLIPSIGESAGPLVLLQAMSHGTPWLATPECNAAGDEAGGIVTELANFPGYIDKLLKNKELAGELGRLGIEHWKHSFKWEKSLESFINLINGKKPEISLAMPDELRQKNKEIVEKLYPINRIEKTEPAMKISAIIYSEGNMDYLGDCIESLAKQDFRWENFELIIADTGNENLKKHFSKNGLNLVYRHFPGQKKSSSLNSSIETAKGQIILFLDEKMTFGPELLSAHFEKQISENFRHSILGKTGFAEPPLELKFSTEMAGSSATNFNYRSLISGSKYDFRLFRLVNLSAPKEILINAGLFDENLPDISEECPEFGYRLYQNGMKVIYDESISAKRHDFTTYELLIKNRVHFGRRLYHILKKHPLQNNPALYEFGIDGIDGAGVEKIREKAARNEVNFNKVTQMFATLSKTMHPAKKVSLNGKIFSYDEMLVRVQDYLKIALEYSIWAGILEESKKNAEELETSPGTADDEFIFSVIIPTYNRGDILRKCLEALRDQSFDTSKFEVFVCDDGSTDNTADVVDSFESNFRLTYLKQENSGPGAARNRGIERATGKYLLIINDDTIAAKDLLQKHFEAQNKVYGRKAAVMGTFEYTADAKVKPFVYFLSKSPIVFAYPIMEHGKFYNYRFFWTCNISIERRAVLQAGMFDEYYSDPMIEDTELGYRLEKLGWSVYYDTGCKSWHDHSMDINGFMKRQRMSGRNVVKLIEKHPEILEREKKLFGFEDLSKQTLDELRAFIEDHAEIANKNAEFIAKIDTLEIYNPEFIPVSQTVSFKADELVEEVGKLIVDIHFVHFYSGLIEGVEKKASKKDARDLISEIAQKAGKLEDAVESPEPPTTANSVSSGKRKPKILFTMFGWNESGGGTMYPRAVAIELAKRGWDVTVFYAGLKHPTVDMPYYTYRSIDSGVNLIGIMNRPVHFTMEKNPELEIEDKNVTRVFGEILKEINPDVVHFHNFLGLSFEIASIAKSRGVRIIYTPHNYHLPDPRLYMIKSNLESWDSSNFWDNSDLPAQNPGLAAEYETRQKKALKIINKDIGLTLAISHRVKEILVDFGADGSKIRTAHQIPYLSEGIKTNSAVHSPVKFAFLGTVIPHKGVHKIAEAANLLNDLNFEIDIYGDGNALYAEEIRQNDKFGKLNFRGSYNSGSLEQIASETDAVITPSIWEEGAGLVIPEAISMGLPVICARIGGMPEFIVDGKTGFTYPHKSSRNLAAILRRLIENPALLTDMKKNTKTDLKFSDFVDYIEQVYSLTNFKEVPEFLFK